MRSATQREEKRVLDMSVVCFRRVAYSSMENDTAFTNG